MGDFLFVFAGTKYNIFAQVAVVQPAPATAVLCEFINLGDFGWGDGIFAFRKMPKRGTIPGVQGANAVPNAMGRFDSAHTGGANAAEIVDFKT